ncbi:pyrimidine reductase family protein [Mycobacteroides salmoniphilum]|uniref:pyrimidine reductase family protein n=1 Tax=Mycobacteroides salmoniphilum TaxID=404941 RepID=UPI000993C83B|nr:pyrimidine reductase family protein [Mycobacteroides salmoniphilum]
MADSDGEQAIQYPAGIQLTQLTTGAPVDSGELVDLYDYPSDNGLCLRANMIGSLDGAATVTGLSGGLGGEGDRAVFAAMRANADVILVGAGTVRTERYHGAHLPVGLRQRRQARGQSEVPVIAVVTASGAVDPSIPLFTESEVAPIVVTSASGARNVASRVSGVQVLVADSAGTVDLRTALAQLHSRGLSRVLCEGGPSLLGTLLAAQLVDELCLTSAPTTVGGGATRITAGPSEVLTSWRRVLLLGDADGYLFARHVRA